MKKWLYLAVVVGLLNSLYGCATLSQAGYPGEASNKGKKVTASLSHFNVLFLIPPDNFETFLH